MKPFTDNDFEEALVQYWAGASQFEGEDPAHDIGHIRRVAAMAVTIAEQEGGRLEVVRPAAWFHDLVNLPKDHPERAKASTYAARAAREILISLDYPAQCYDDIAHAIEAHSFSAAITAKTLEAKILQDADRLDALGAIGIARTFSVNGQLGRRLFSAQDPFARARALDDTRYGLDHFYLKLLRLPEQMNTAAARLMARERVSFMEDFITQLASEISVREPETV